MIHTHSVPLWKRAATAAFLSILAFATPAIADYNVDLSWPTDVDNVDYNVSDAQWNYVTSGQPNPSDGFCTIQVPDGATAILLATSSLDESFTELTEGADYTSETGADGVTTFILPIPPTLPHVKFCEFYKVKFAK